VRIEKENTTIVNGAGKVRSTARLGDIQRERVKIVEPHISDWFKKKIVTDTPPRADFVREVYSSIESCQTTLPSGFLFRGRRAGFSIAELEELSEFIWDIKIRVTSGVNFT
jgi:hypothetical protein